MKIIYPKEKEEDWFYKCYEFQSKEPCNDEEKLIYGVDEKNSKDCVRLYITKEKFKDSDKEFFKLNETNRMFYHFISDKYFESEKGVDDFAKSLLGEYNKE